MLSFSRARPLLPGDLVEVRSREEILATLDAGGALDGLVFMPEMLAFCGRQFRVGKRADKTCDTVKDSGLRRMRDTVHLENLRCDGSGHAGCQASCLIFWKEVWLKRPGEPARAPAHGPMATADTVQAATIRAPSSDPAAVVYRCQNTDVREASTPLPSWAPMQYVRDIWSGNASVKEVLQAILWFAARWARQKFPGYRVQIWLFNQAHFLTGEGPLFNLQGDLTKTPTGKLDLAVGERVRVKSVEEIRATLDAEQKNRGLYFDQEMTPHCGHTFQVRTRVTRIINEKTGKLINIPGGCVILEGGYCTGRYHKACPREIYQYWRELWVERT
jgi:hypothetical protein